jgi:hypothetical protein
MAEHGRVDHHGLASLAQSLADRAEAGHYVAVAARVQELMGAGLPQGGEA